MKCKGETMIKTIIFDLGGVYFTDGSTKSIKIISEKYRIRQALVHEIFKGDIGTKYRSNMITHDEYWEMAKEYWKRPEISTDELSQIWHNNYLPIQGTIEIIRKLKAKGYRLIFLSDNVQERVDFLQEKYDFLKDFSGGGVFSHVAKIRKPDLEIYKMALDIANAPAENCVYIDDKANLLEPAQKLGMHTIHFTSPQSLADELASLQVTYGTAENK